MKKGDKPKPKKENGEETQPGEVSPPILRRRHPRHLRRRRSRRRPRLHPRARKRRSRTRRVNSRTATASRCSLERVRGSRCRRRPLRRRKKPHLRLRRRRQAMRRQRRTRRTARASIRRATAKNPRPVLKAWFLSMTGPAPCRNSEADLASKLGAPDQHRRPKLFGQVAARRKTRCLTRRAGDCVSRSSLKPEADNASMIAGR